MHIARRIPRHTSVSTKSSVLSKLQKEMQIEIKKEQLEIQNQQVVPKKHQEILDLQLAMKLVQMKTE